MEADMSGLISTLKRDKWTFWVISIWSFVILMLGIGVMVILWGLVSRQGKPPVANLDSVILYTQAAQTIQAEFTQQALTQQATESLMPPTVTPSQVWVESATPTLTILEPSLTLPLPTLTPTPTPTPIPTRIIPSLTPVPVLCNSVQFVRDVTVIDQTPFAPNTDFIKIWRVKNTGSCTWTKDYSLVFVSGDLMDAKKSVFLPYEVKPNNTLDIAIEMKSPGKPGSYRGDWILRAPDGTYFGAGLNGTATLYVSIKVIDLSNPDLVYDFAANYCKAGWKTGAGKLPCPGTGSGTEGFVTLMDKPRLENRQEDEWTLVSHPNNSNNGWISGTYPEFEILPGHHFIAWVGCLADSKGCNVIFRLDFKNSKTDAIVNLGAWHEVYDGEVTKIDLDLSQHAGKRGSFILTVEVNGGTPERANAFWFVPGIVQGKLPTATPTVVPPTPTPTPTDGNENSHTVD
jgi:hypothetical protein